MTADQGGAAPPQHQDQDDRIDQLAARQERTETKLDRVLDLLGDSKDKPGGPGPAPAPGAGTPPDHMGEIKQAIRDVRAEEQQAADAAAHKAEHDRLKDQPEPEHQPRESGPTWKERLQSVMFGGDAG